jgi:hypothetical protein
MRSFFKIGFCLTFLFSSLSAIDARTLEAEQNGPPTGNYLCYYYGYNYALTSSSLSDIDILSGLRMNIVGETVRFRQEGSILTLLEGKFKGATGLYKKDSEGKPAIVFRRKENETKGHKIDVSDTWCYLDKG